MNLRNVIIKKNVSLDVAFFIDLRHHFIISNMFGSRRHRQPGVVTRFNVRLLGVFLLICLVFSGAVVFSVRQARGDQKAARAAASAFYGRLQVRDFEGARALLSRERQGVLSAQTLRKTWAQFEAKHGQLRSWEIAQTPTVYGNRVSIFPRYVE